MLVVDDEAAIRNSLAGSLTLEGYDVITSPDGGSALALLAERMPDIVILDVMMPVVDGLEVCRRMRAVGYDIPVLLLTARDLDDGVDIRALGADDYLPKPFALDELIARLSTLLRDVADDPAGGRLEYADLVMDLTTREASRDGVLLQLTSAERNLLELFLQHPEQVLTRADILREIWGLDIDSGSNLTDLVVDYLRRKIELHGRPRLLHDVGKGGYILRSQHEHGS